MLSKISPGSGRDPGCSVSGRTERAYGVFAAPSIGWCIFLRAVRASQTRLEGTHVVGAIWLTILILVAKPAIRWML